MPKKPEPGSSVARREFLEVSAATLGGVGAGMICLEGTGALSHVSLRNKPEVFNEPCMFAAIAVKGKSAPVHGAHDLTCSLDVAKDYFDGLEAPHKVFHTFADSAHSPLFEEPERLCAVLRDDVLAPLSRGG